MGRLFIAEKPSMGRALAQVLGSPRPAEGHILCAGGDVVSWCFGHLLEQADPDTYDPRYKQWQLDHLPIIPATWKVGVRSDAKAQVRIIQKLLKTCDTVVNFGDPEREGQLIVDELLEHLGWRGHTLRLWLNSADEKSVRKALNEMKDNSAFHPLSQSALARSRADWIVGMNLTRAMTLMGRAQGVVASGQVLSIGRVQTPVLAIVVNRDREIERFIPKDYFSPYVVAQHQNGAFKASWVPADDCPGIDAESRLVDESIAKQLVARVQGQDGVVIDVKAEEKAEPPALPHTLGSLQAAADTKLGLSAQQTLNVAQSLYEKKITSYPRTDCHYLKEEQFEEASSILSVLGEYKCPGAGGANSELKSAAWNSSKVDAHHGIIPTGMPPIGLSKDEAGVFAIIAEGYIRQFYPPYRYMTHTVLLDISGETWKCQGRSVIAQGWKALGGASNEKAVEDLPHGMKKGDGVRAIESGYDAQKTRPPAYFTEGTLLQAMENVHRFVGDPRLKKLLKDAKGIGTSATQASIIETLKGRGFIERKGKKIISSSTGRMLVDAVPKPVTDPGTTALWEHILGAVAGGKVSLPAFMAEQEKLVRQYLAEIEQVKFPGRVPPKPCPECGHPLERRTGKQGAYWACFKKEKHAQGEPHYFDDKDGEPVQQSRNKSVDTSVASHPCPQCGNRLRRLESRKKAGFYFWVCSEEGHPMLVDDAGKPGSPMEFSPKPSSGKKDSKSTTKKRGR